MKSLFRPAWLAAVPLALSVGWAGVQAQVPAESVAALAAPPKVETGPWLYRGSDIPPDPEWIFGELPNGLRYAVRRNGVPPGQVSIRVRIDAGSLNESDEERGFAHLIEHLVFRQSKYLGEAQAIPTWQRLGATFGSDTNAETSPTTTTFKIDLPSATPESLDESFKLLSGMMIAPTLSEANIKAELPIVLAEKREHAGAAERIDRGMRQTLYGGQPLANRDPIGTDETLNGAHEGAVRDFHARWYRPENATVIVAGDASQQELAALVTKWFSDWPVRGPHVATPSFGQPQANDGTLDLPAGAPAPAKSKPKGKALPAAAFSPAPVGRAAVQVEPDLPRSISWAVLRPWRQVTDSVVYNQGLMIDNVAQQIVNRRLEDLARNGGSYLSARVDRQKISRSSDGTYVTVAPLGSDWAKAVADVRAVIADALVTPPSQQEIDRELAEMRIAYANSLEQRDLLPGAQLADDIVQALDIRETVASPETVLSIFDGSVKLFTPETVLQHTRNLFSGTVTRTFMITPQQGEADAPALRAAMLAPVAPGAAVRVAYKNLSFAELPPIGTPQQAVTIARTGIADIEQIDFANGVRAQIWPTDDEPGRVTVKVRFGAGYRAFTPDDAPYAYIGSSALVASGVGPLSEGDLERIATGRKLGFGFRIEDTDFTFSAETRRDDMADQLYLFAAKLSQPRWDAAPLERAKAAARLQYDALAASPQGVLGRDLDWLKRNRDPRYRTPAPAETDAVTAERFRAIWEPILLTGPVEVQVFGDIDRAATIAALERTFGALATRAPLPATLAPATLQSPAGGAAPVVLSHKGDPSQAAAMVFWPTGGGVEGVREGRQLRILAELFSNRLLDRMREKLGASYAPQVYSDWPVDLSSGGSIVALAQLQPKDVPAFYAAADEIAADLAAYPPSTDELARVTEPLKQAITRAFTGSAYFMGQVEGATSEPSRYAALRTLLPDSTVTTPQAMRALAAKYLVRGKAWRLAVLPQGEPLSAAAASSPAARAEK